MCRWFDSALGHPDSIVPMFDLRSFRQALLTGPSMTQSQTWAVLGSVCGVLGIAAGAYLGVSGAVSQSDPAALGASLASVGSIVCVSLSGMGVIAGRDWPRRRA